MSVHVEHMCVRGRTATFIEFIGISASPSPQPTFTITGRAGNVTSTEEELKKKERKRRNEKKMETSGGEKRGTKKKRVTKTSEKETRPSEGEIWQMSLIGYIVR